MYYKETILLLYGILSLLGQGRADFKLECRILILEIHFLVCGLCDNTAAPQTCYVNTSGLDTSTGVDAGHPLATVAHALASTLPSQSLTVIMAPGTYHIGQSIDIYDRVGVTIQSTSNVQGGDVILLAPPAGVILGVRTNYTVQSSIILTGLTLTNSSSSALKVVGSVSLEISNCKVSASQHISSSVSV